MKPASRGTIIWLGLLGSAFGQPTAKPLTFEVASIRPSAETRGTFIRPSPGGDLRVAGASLKFLISLAYGVRDFQISGGPAWLDSARFDIEARADTSDKTEPPGALGENPGPRRQMIVRLRNLLAERFQFMFHRETREQGVYALVVAKSGSKLRESTDDRSLIRMFPRGTITGHAAELGLLSLNLANELGRPVIDKTGLTGKYDFELKWTPEASLQSGPSPGAELSRSPDDSGPSIFTALADELGLRLESTKGPVEMLVVDRAEKPSAN